MAKRCSHAITLKTLGQGWQAKKQGFRWAYTHNEAGVRIQKNPFDKKCWDLFSDHGPHEIIRDAKRANEIVEWIMEE